MDVVKNYIKRYTYDRKINIALEKTQNVQMQTSYSLKFRKVLPLVNFKSIRNNTQVIAYLLYYTYGIIKYDADSQYPYHKAVPSTRGLPTINLHILENVDGVFYLSTYNMYTHHLENRIVIELEKQSELAKLVLKDQPIILQSFNIFTLGSLYGEFSYQLFLLDCGHVLSQLSLLLERLAIDYRIIVAFSEESNSLNQYLPTNHYFLSGVSINLMNYEKSNEEYEEYIAIQNEWLGLHSSTFPCMMEMYQNSNCTYDFTKIHTVNPYLKKLPVKEFEEILQNRTSAHNTLGLASFENDAKVAKQLLNFLKQMDTGAMILYFYSGAAKCFYKVENGVTKKVKPKLPIVLSDLLLQFETGITLTSLTGLVWLSCGSEDLYENSIQHKKIHFKAAYLAQEISLYSTELKCFCRPIKNNNELMFKKAFNHELIYTLCIGNSVYENVQIDLRKG